MIAQEIMQRISSGMKEGSHHDGEGVDSRFFILDDKWGVKFPYWDYGDQNGHKKGFERLRDEMFFRQRHAARYGLAPIVKGKFDLPEIGYYGLITERVDLFKNYIYEMTYSQERQAAYSVEKEAFHALGYCYCDLHSGNYGYRAHNHKLVRLDWGSTGIAVDLRYVRP